MSTVAMGQWGQVEDLPLKAYAVYEPGDDPADVRTADITWVDAAEQVTNTAVHGPQGWLVETTWRDQAGNITQSLDGTGWARVQATDPALRPTVAWEASTINQHTEIPATPTEAGEAGESQWLLTDTYGPAVTASLRDGTTGVFRPHTRYVYDNSPGVDPGLVTGRPDDAVGGMIVQESTSAAGVDLTGDHDVLRTRYEYVPVVAGDGDGWQLGTPVVTKRQDGAGWSATVNRFTPDGEQIEIRRPGGATNTGGTTGAGVDALSTTTLYYTAAGSGECGNKPAWEGLVCRTGPSGQPDTGLDAPTVPTTRYASYSDEGQPLVVVETSGSSGGSGSRTTTSSYDALGRVVSMSKVLAGAGVAADTVNTDYSYNDQGMVSSVSSAGQDLSTSYDSWGRVTSTVDAHGSSSATTYTPAGHIATVTDTVIDTGPGSAPGLDVTATYSYGSYGELTSFDPGGGVGAFTYAYTRTGQIRKVSYPNGMDAITDYTETGTPVALTYTQTNPTESSGGSGPVDVAGFTAVTDVAGRTVAQTSTGSAQDFNFDDLGRLTRTQDHRAGECVTRSYGFDAASNRTTTRVYGPDQDGGCQTTTPAVDRTHVFDTAGRNRTTTTTSGSGSSGESGGYVYDTFGRTLRLPAADTTTGGSGSGDVEATYAVDDMVATLTQTIPGETEGSAPVVEKMTYTLDPARRVDTITTTRDGTETSRLRYRYTGPGDSPTLVETSTDQGTTWSHTRYITAPGLGMAATTTTGGGQSGQAGSLQIANLHGDIVATIPSTPGSAVLDHWTETDEYGNPVDAGTATATGRYGYLGTHQRATDTPNGGLTLMGARLYNPTTGAFLTPDPILDGGASAYGYPHDPVGGRDLTGEAWWGSTRGWYGTLGRGNFHPWGATSKSGHWWGKKRALYWSRADIAKISRNGFWSWVGTLSDAAAGVTAGSALTKKLSAFLKRAGVIGGFLTFSLGKFADSIKSKADEAFHRGRTFRTTFYMALTPNPFTWPFAGWRNWWE